MPAVHPQAQPRVGLGGHAQLQHYAVNDGDDDEQADRRVGDPREVLEYLTPGMAVSNQ